MCVGGVVCACESSSAEARCVKSPTELELPVLESYPEWELGTELRLSTKTAPSLQTPIDFFLISYLISLNMKILNFVPKTMLNRLNSLLYTVMSNVHFNV